MCTLYKCINKTLFIILILVRMLSRVALTVHAYSNRLFGFAVVRFEHCGTYYDDGD